MNYDLILEIYMGETTVPGVPKFLTERGFKKHAGIEVLNLDGIRDGSMELDYIKLHGSIDWWLDDKRRIIVSHVPDFPYAKLSERIMLYPIYEKYVTRDPYFTLYEYFRKSLFKEDILIIIGYSFRDLSINNTFLEWLHSKPESRLIIAKKKDHEYIKKILENNDKVENRIQFIGEHFGENGFFPLLESTLANPIG